MWLGLDDGPIDSLLEGMVLGFREGKVDGKISSLGRNEGSIESTVVLGDWDGSSFSNGGKEG